MKLNNKFTIHEAVVQRKRAVVSVLRKKNIPGDYFIN